MEVAGIVANPNTSTFWKAASPLCPMMRGFGIGYLKEPLGRLIVDEGQNYNYIRIEYEPGAKEEALIEAVEAQLRTIRHHKQR